MSKVVINNVELELNLLDADIMEKFENLNNEIQVKIQDPAIYAGKSNADCMRVQCRLIEEYVDKLFGAGTANRIFPSGNDLGIRMDGFGKITQMSESANQEINELSSKYANRARNRAERRAQQGYKGKKNRNHMPPRTN